MTTNPRPNRVVVQIWLSRAVVKLIDHARIDRELRSRQEMIEAIVTEWAARPSPTTTDEEMLRQSGEGS